jgi:hypothetical protein
VLPWEVRVVVISDECPKGKMVKFVDLEDSFLPSALAVSVKTVRFSGASEEM